MNEIQIFNNEEFGSVRSLTVNGEPYFIGKDVAVALGYENPSKAVRDHVDEDDKIMGVQNVTPSIVDSLGREQYPTFINESGVYSLVFGSNLPSAKRFKKWVTSEVLPAIRKHGVFVMDDIINNTDALIEALQAFREERIRRRELEQENAVQRQQIGELSPKASYYDVVLQTPDLISISKIAKDYGKSAQWMNRYLKEKGIQYKQGNVWLLRQKYAEQGYTKSRTDVYTTGDGETHSKLHTYWNQKGRLFIYDTLKQDGILPLIEQ